MTAIGIRILPILLYILFDGVLILFQSDRIKITDKYDIRFG